MKQLEGFDFDSYKWSIENVKLEFLTHTESFYQKEKKEFGKPVHSHVFYELLFSTSDNTEFIYGQKRMVLAKNTFVITAPYYIHRATAQRSEDLFSVGFLFKQNNQKELPKQDLFALLNEAFSDKDCIIGSGDENLAELCFQLKRYFGTQDSFAEGSMVATFLLILFHVLRLMQSREGQAFTVIKKGEQEKTFSTRIPSEIASKINNILSESFTTDVTPEGLSAAYYISAKQINRYIYNQYGQTFMQRKTALRMSYAQKLLRESSLPIEKISSKVGYHSINSFYSAFKVFFGITPNQYRMGIAPVK